MSHLKLYLLGAPRIALGDVAVDLPHRKMIAMLVYIACCRQTLPRDTIATMLWPSLDRKSARASLRRELHGLNRHIGTEWLTATRNEIGLNPNTSVWIDVEAFRHTLSLATKESTQNSHEKENDRQETHEVIQSLQDTVALYQGDFMTGFTLPDCPTFDDWQFFESESLRRDYASVLAQLATTMREQGEYNSAIEYTRRWLALDLLEESVHRELMRLYALAGQQAAALRQYDECVRVLEEELGVPPDEETTALQEAIQTRRFPGPQFASGQPIAATSVSVSSASDFVPKQHNLPPQATSFIGRHDELDAIYQMVSKPEEYRLVTLLGPGGIGKTRLALQAAQRLVHHIATPDHPATNHPLPLFPNGLYFVPMETVQNSEEMVVAIADAVAFTFQGDADPQTQLLRYLQSKEMLLILDNLEHLVEEIDLVAAMLQDAPRIALLATSRTALALQEEWLYIIEGFTPPTADEEMETIEGNSAVQLFWERARRADSSLMLTDEVLTQIVRICHLVDGLPLGLELAATWVRVLSIREIADEIQNNLDFLTTTKRGVPERHNSLRTVLEQTWKLLEPAEQNVFCRLALFQNGFTRQAAVRVAGASMVVLAALVRKSIISNNREGRYAMHGLLRQLAEAKLHEQALPIDEIAAKHSRYYGLLLQQVEEELLGANHATVLEQIGQEIGNISRGWRWALAHVADHSADPDLVNRYIEALFQFYDTRSRFQEGYEAFQIAWNSLDDLEDDPNLQLSLGRIRSRLGWFAFQIGRPLEAKQHLQQSLALLRKVDASREIVFALNYLGALHRHLDEYEEAKQALHESEQRCRERNDRFGLTVALNILGQVAYLQQDYAQAQAYCEESLMLKQTIGDRRGITFSLLYLGLVALAQADHAKALRLFRESILISEEHGDRRSIAIGLNHLAAAEIALGHLDDAHTLYQQSLEIYTEISNLLGIVTTQIKLGDLAYSQDQLEAAIANYETALQKAENLQLSPQALEALIGPVQRWLAQVERSESRSNGSKDKLIV